MSEIILKNITKTYDSQNFAAKDISFEVKDREFVVLTELYKIRIVYGKLA